MGQLTVTEAAWLIETMSLYNEGAEDIEYAIRNFTKGLSNDPVFNVAAWMKYNFGPCLYGEDDDSWIELSKELNQIYNS